MSLRQNTKPTPIGDRGASALSSPMVVLSDSPLAGDDPMDYEVVSDSGRSYLVRLRADACECPDALHRKVECRHLKRAKFATGVYAIPEWVGLDSLDRGLGDHCDGEVRVETGRGPRPLAEVSSRE